MKKYTANYANTNSNFVIQNLQENKTEDTELYAFCCVIKNILQRGSPTMMSQFLQEKLGEIHKENDFNELFIYAQTEKAQWFSTIKGDEQRNYFPAKDFYENIIPQEFGEYSFVQSLIIPEIEINEICGFNEKFVNQQVDFYLPQAKLIIEIDGSQHKIQNNKISDNERDEYLKSKKIQVIRISTDELRNKTYSEKIASIKNHLNQHKKLLNRYQSAYKFFSENKIIPTEILKTKFIPTAIIRFQLLVLELLMNGTLTLSEDWNFNIFTDVDLGDFDELAIEDILSWLNNLYLLKNKEGITLPKINIKVSKKEEFFLPDHININLSLCKRYTDENILYPNTIFIRTDYFDKKREVNYFQVSVSEPINYNVSKDDEKIIEFFLQNIFGKKHLRYGQFPIIANALNRKDTIGLLPTGGGKSLCYQLPCLLQPSINFVVCPIKSLMYDQKENLTNIFITNTNWITSDLSTEEKKNIEMNFEQGKYLFTWVSPERFQIQEFRDRIKNINSNFSIAYAVIDEVHCLSEWGHSFRLSYLNLAKTIDNLGLKDENGEGKIKFLGLTATASINVLKDIKIEFSRQKAQLEDENIKSLTDYSREELEFEIINDDGEKKDKLYTILDKFKQEDNFLETEEKAGIIFTPHVNGAKGCFKLSNSLNNKYPQKINWYSGKAPSEKTYTYVKIQKHIINNTVEVKNEIKKQLQEFDKILSKNEIETIIKNNYKEISTIQQKASSTNNFINLLIKEIPKFSEEVFKQHKKKVQKAFKNNEYPLLVATKSFGMGIDKDNIFYTIHYGIPSSVESLYQEAGRAGRWDKTKPENKHKKGQCLVLFSPETLTENQEDSHDYISEVFNQETTIKRIDEIIDKIPREKQKDISVQLFLFKQGLNDIDDDLKNILEFIDEHFKENKTEDVFFNNNQEKQEKIIYRLSLLGIVKDWTNNFKDKFVVKFASMDETHIIKSIENYIGKYEPTLNIASEIERVNEDSFLKRSIKYLLQWIFDHIVYNRKQSLKTLYDWCLNFKDSKSFKQQLDSYFIFNDLTFILQDIGEKPLNYHLWFETLYFEPEGSKKIFIPEIKNERLKNEKCQNLRDAISRFLESYKNNVGLNFVSGLIRLALDDFDNLDGRNRFENALKAIATGFEKEQQDEILAKLKDLGRYFKNHQQEQICLSIEKCFSKEIFVSFAEDYKLDYLLDYLYQEQLKNLKKLNHKLYEQLTKIK